MNEGLRLTDNQKLFLEKISTSPFFGSDMGLSSERVRDTYKQLRQKGFQVYSVRNYTRGNKTKKSNKIRFVIYFMDGQEDEVIKMMHEEMGFVNNQESIKQHVYNGSYQGRYDEEFMKKESERHKKVMENMKKRRSGA